MAGPSLRCMAAVQALALSYANRGLLLGGARVCLRLPCACTPVATLRACAAGAVQCRGPRLRAVRVPLAAPHSLTPTCHRVPQVLVSLEDPGYAPEAGAAYFSFSVLPADATPRLVGGTVGAALDAQSAAAADSDVGADPDLPTLVSRMGDEPVSPVEAKRACVRS